MTYICKGSMVIGNGCGECLKCKKEIKYPKKGDVIEIDGKESGWYTCNVLNVGETTIHFSFDNGYEGVMRLYGLPWRYPIDPEQQKRDDIMEAWRRMSIDFAHDTEKSMVHAGTFIDMLFNKGFVEVEK